jgi:hypothetical protein
MFVFVFFNSFNVLKLKLKKYMRKYYFSIFLNKKILKKYYIPQY